MYLLVIIIYPLIHKMVKSQKIRFLILGFLSIYYVIISNFNSSLGMYATLVSSIYYLIYFELGSFVATNRLDTKKRKILIVGYLGILVFSIFTAGSLFTTILTDLVLYPVAVCVFYYLSVLLKESKLLKIIGAYSFSIFLFHEPLFTFNLSRGFRNQNLYNEYYITILIVIISIVLSISFSKLLKYTGLSRFIFLQKKR